MAVRRTLAIALTALAALGACSDDGDDTSEAPEATGSSSMAPGVATSEIQAGTEPAPSAASTPATAPSTPAPTPVVAVADTGVPGLDSEDDFCAAWSRFGGSWQLLVQAGAGADPAEVARLEVIASPVVQDAFDDVFAVWPEQLASERDVVADGYFGAFQRRSADAAAALAAAGATESDRAALAQAWDAALAAYDPSTMLSVAVPPELEPLVSEAAIAFSEQRVALPVDPSMVITVETPLTDDFLATACPDQGWIVGQDVVEDAA